MRRVRSSDDLARPHDLRDSKAILQHAEMNDLIAGDGQNDGIGRLYDLAARFQPRSQLADDNRAGITGEDVVNLKPNAFEQFAAIASEVNDRLPTSFFAKPRQCADIARDIPFEHFGEKLRNFFWSGAAPKPSEKLLSYGEFCS
jgi:hypothetical protein